MKGNLPQEVLDAVLETLPVEFSVVDADDNVLAWNKHETRIFKRPMRLWEGMCAIVILQKVWPKSRPS